MFTQVRWIFRKTSSLGSYLTLANANSLKNPLIGHFTNFVSNQSTQILVCYYLIHMEV